MSGNLSGVRLVLSLFFSRLALLFLSRPVVAVPSGQLPCRVEPRSQGRLLTINCSNVIRSLINHYSASSAKSHLWTHLATVTGYNPKQFASTFIALKPTVGFKRFLLFEATASCVFGRDTYMTASKDSLLIL